MNFQRQLGGMTKLSIPSDDMQRKPDEAFIGLLNASKRISDGLEQVLWFMFPRRRSNAKEKQFEWPEYEEGGK